MPLESFHSLQEDWKQEIQHMFDDLRTKEKVPALADGCRGAASKPTSPSSLLLRDPFGSSVLCFLGSY